MRVSTTWALAAPVGLTWMPPPTAPVPLLVKTLLVTNVFEVPAKFAILSPTAVPRRKPNTTVSSTCSAAPLVKLMPIRADACAVDRQAAQADDDRPGVRSRCR